MPGVYNEYDYDVVGFMVGSVTKNNLKSKERVKEGFKLIGLPSSGLHTNGFSLVRSIFDTDSNIKNLSQKVPNEERNLGELLAEPHREYLSDIFPFINDIEAISHITGGGLYKNLPRVFPNNLQARISKNSWNIPNLFKYIHQKGNLNDKEMFEVFNMAICLIAVIDAENTTSVEQICNELGENIYPLGLIEKGKQAIRIEGTW